MNFLPDNYEAPKPTNQLYLKLQDGENRIRILSRPIVGWEDWNAEKKPVRYKMNEKPAKPFDASKPMKHFWAFIVWNVNEEMIQIMQITQATIRSCLESLSKDQDWGSPFEYDIKINKKGEKMETEYTVNPAPHKPVSQEILKAFRDRPIKLEALYEGLDPFATIYTSYTPLMSEADESKIQPIGDHVKPLDMEKISDNQFIELSELKNKCSSESQKGFDEYLIKAFNVSLCDLPLKEYLNVKNKLIFRADEYQKYLLEAEIKDTPESRKEAKKK